MASKTVVSSTFFLAEDSFELSLFESQSVIVTPVTPVIVLSYAFSSIPGMASDSPRIIDDNCACEPG